MSWKKFTILIALASLWSEPGHAQVLPESEAITSPECEMISSVLGTVSLIQNAHRNENHSIPLESNTALEHHLERISEQELLPSQFRSDFPTEYEVMTTYLSTLRDAMTATTAGHNAYADWVLSRSLTPEFNQGLSSLERYWKCETLDSLAPLEMAASTENSLFETSPAMASEQEPKKPILSVNGNTAVRSPLPNRGVLRPAKINEPVPLKINIVALVGMALSTMLAALYFANRRPKKREARRLIQTPVTVRLGQTKHELMMVDITRNGFKLRHTHLIDAQRKLQVHLNDTWHSGHIKWYNNAFAGVMFAKPINIQTFESIVMASIGNESI